VKTRQLALSKHEFIGENQGNLDSMNSIFLFYYSYPISMQDLSTVDLRTSQTFNKGEAYSKLLAVTAKGLCCPLWTWSKYVAAEPEGTWVETLLQTGPEANLLQQNQIRAETIYQKHCRGTWEEILLQRDLKQTSCSRLNHSRHIAEGPESKTSFKGTWIIQAREYSEQEAVIKGYFSFIQTHFGSNIPPVQTASRSTCTFHLYKQQQGSIFISHFVLKFQIFLETSSFDLIEVSIFKYSLIFIPHFIHIKFP